MTYFIFARHVMQDKMLERERKRERERDNLIHSYTMDTQTFYSTF